MYIPEPNHDRHYKLEEAAGLMGLSVKTVLQMISKGAIKAELSSKDVWYIPSSEIAKQIIKPHKMSRAVKQKKFHKRYLKHEKGKAESRDGRPSGWPVNPEHSDSNRPPK